MLCIVFIVSLVNKRFSNRYIHTRVCRCLESVFKKWLIVYIELK